MTGSAPRKERTIRQELKLQALIVFGFVGIIWAIEVLDLALFGGGLDSLGIRPRSASGLIGLITAPFLHGGLAHVAANTVPFIILAWLVMLRETWHLPAVGAFVTVVGGAAVWLVGRADSVHVGASGLIFGLFGYLLLAGWFERKLGTIVLSLLVLSVYGGMIFGVLPGQPGISWESHLFGFLAGGLAARIFARRPRAPTTP